MTCQQHLVVPTHAQVRYLIATLDGDAHSIRHEMCHARYYLEPGYREAVASVWGDQLDATQQAAIRG